MYLCLSRSLVISTRNEKRAEMKVCSVLPRLLLPGFDECDIHLSLSLSRSLARSLSRSRLPPPFRSLALSIRWTLCYTYLGEIENAGEFSPTVAIRIPRIKTGRGWRKKFNQLKPTEYSYVILISKKLYIFLRFFFFSLSLFLLTITIRDRQAGGIYFFRDSFFLKFTYSLLIEIVNNK